MMLELRDYQKRSLDVLENYFRRCATCCGCTGRL